ncbi:HIG1 domain-containing protein [Algimonas porphyrae]|uniref:HIG1 domain-containing protein n=1 Tax=Algimonas porphyrae TaxID=1128113 RepID=A0ABQ5V3G2_9PROT|nr:HIG1 domain-containing protein [Algimonas porphyrae]GLQ22069.1 hypothetical protein GCM10007854_30240 [Algimonas porphyrae]
MSTILFILAGLAMLYVVYTLVIGASNMAKTNEGSREKSNSWMWKRVGGQALALGLLLLAFWVRKNGG